jgi:2,3-bisphosphoglycerate-independent phosphoglycerate mutase
LNEGEPGRKIPRTIVVVPGLASQLGGDSVLRGGPKTFPKMAEMGRITRISALPEVETPEGLYLGMHPDEVQIAQGPLTVAALGADPPDRSTQFHLSLLTFADGTLQIPSVVPNEAELRVILEQGAKLNTKTLTLVEGEELDHGLVWEGLGDIYTVGPKEAAGKGIRENLPQGDAEPLLRRYIDDSINLLDELELNQRRIEEGLAPINLLWPWGQGVRPRVPNLALRRGEPAIVQSEELRMVGLTRLVGYRHTDRKAYRAGINLDLTKIASLAMTSPLLFVVVSGPARMRAEGLLDELEWFTREMDEKFFSPLFEVTLREKRRLLLVSPSQEGQGLSLLIDHEQTSSNIYPFDERSLDESAVGTSDLSTLIQGAIA